MRPHQPRPTPHMKGDDQDRAQEGGHTNHPPPPMCRETTGDNGRQDHFRAQEADHTNQHQSGQIERCIKNPNSKLFGEKGLVNMDVSYTKLCRQLVGPPPQIGVSTGMKYDEILHLPNERLKHFATLPSANSWSQCVYAHVCKIGFFLGPAIPDVLHRVGIKK